jgi:hypothetical protein
LLTRVSYRWHFNNAGFSDKHNNSGDVYTARWVDGLSEGSAFASLFGRLAAAGTPTKDKIECAFSKKKPRMRYLCKQAHKKWRSGVTCGNIAAGKFHKVSLISRHCMAAEWSKVISFN